MFLSRIARLARTARSVGTDDRGVALAAVMAFMAAGVLLSAVVATTVVSGQQVSQSTRAGVQSQAAAEAGIAVARASLIRGQCVNPATYVSAGQADDPATAAVDETLPAYSAQIQYSTNNGTSWINGCPPSVQQPARILSTGYAITPGMTNNDAGDETTIEARLETVQNAGTLNPSGPAVYSYNTSGFGGSGKLISTGGYDASILIRSGNVTCDGAANGAADLVVKSGNFSGSGSCRVTGNVWVNGSAELSGGGKIGGSLTANSVVSSGDIGGNVWADSTVRLTWSGKVTGWVSAGSLDVAGGIVGQNAWSRTGTTTLSGNGVEGTLFSQGAVTLSNGTTRNIVTNAAATITGGTLSGSLKAGSLTMSNGTLNGGTITGQACFSGGSVNGAVRVGSLKTSGCYTKTGESWWGGWSKITVGASSSPTLDASPGKPSAVVVPEWADFGSDPAHYTSATWGGFTLVTMGTDCSDAKFYQALRTAGTNKALIDARSCSNGLAFGGGSGEQTGQGQNANGFRLRNDVAIIAKKFDFAGSMRFFANDPSKPLNLWLINPDTIRNTSPDCAGQSLKLGGDFRTENVRTMLYTPCELTLASSQNLKGQIFAGSNVKISGAGVLDYVPLGLPGFNLNTGATDSASYTEADRGLAWQRNVAG